MAMTKIILFGIRQFGHLVMHFTSESGERNCQIIARKKARQRQRRIKRIKTKNQPQALSAEEKETEIQVFSAFFLLPTVDGCQNSCGLLAILLQNIAQAQEILRGSSILLDLFTF